MTELAFLSPARCGPDVRLVSPLARTAVDDVSALAKLEVRGDLGEAVLGPGEELVRITPERGLVLVDGDPEPARVRLGAAGLRVYDLSAAYAALEVEGERTMRRLTDLDLERLPAAGPVARGVPALVQRLAGERFRVLVPQELGHYVAEVVEDLEAAP